MERGIFIMNGINQALRIGVVLSCFFLSIAQSSARGFSDQGDDEYNFSWLDPDKKISVLQNRKFQKKGKALFSIMGGMGWSNPYRDTLTFDPRVAYYFAENWGIEVFYNIISNKENTTIKALKASSSSAIPNIREIRSQYGALLHWAPWYAKINVFNKILYFDWYFEGGLGVVGTYLDTNTLVSGSPSFKPEDKTAFFLGTGHQFHITQQFGVRLDVLAAYYKALDQGETGNSVYFSNYQFSFGLGLRL